MMETAVFSKSYCPYCKASKALLSEMGAKYFLIELDQVGSFFPYSTLPILICPNHLHLANMEPWCVFPDDGAAIQNALEEMTQQRSVPNIFIKQQHIGGNSDLQSKKSELPDLLQAAGAV